MGVAELQEVVVVYVGETVGGIGKEGRV